MSRFPTAAHLVSWARVAPGINEVRPARDRPRRDRARQPLPGPASSARPPSPPRKTDTFLGERYRRIARRRGKKKAIVAVGRSILVIIWHLLSDPDARLPPTSAPTSTTTASTPNARKHAHIHQLEALGYKVTLEPAA